MRFLVKPEIIGCPDLKIFFKEWQVGDKDLLITNRYIVAPALGDTPIPCDAIYQEDFGGSEPTDVMVDQMLAAASVKDYTRVIAIGGGTVIDVSKLFVFGAGLSCEEIFDKGASLPKKRQLVAIPTTCGTGSEVTGISIVEMTKRHTKLGLAVPALFADQAVLIPSLLSTVPYGVFATSSVDALIHAIESYISPKSNPCTQALSVAAMRDILTGYAELKAAGEKKLPGDMQAYLLASTMAGIAFSNAGCGPVHALSYPIGAGYHVPHGKSNYMVFAGVFDVYKEMGADLSSLEAELAKILKVDTTAVWPAVFDLLNWVLPVEPISSLGVDLNKCREMAVSVMGNQQRLLVNSPLPLSTEDIEKMYLKCL